MGDFTRQIIKVVSYILFYLFLCLIAIFLDKVIENMRMLVWQTGAGMPFILPLILVLIFTILFTILGFRKVQPWNLRIAYFILLILSIRLVGYWLLSTPFNSRLNEIAKSFVVNVF